MTEARKRRRWLPAAGLALALVPSALFDLPPPVLATQLEPEAPDPADLVITPPDLIAAALRVEVGPRFEEREAAPAPRARLPVAPSMPLAAELTVVRRIPEPSSSWLALFSFASAAIASRGMRRCPRRHRHR